MPTKTTARPRSTHTPSSGAARRFSRSGPTAASRTPRLPSRTPVRGKKKPAKGAGGLGGLLSALPLAAGGRKAARSTGGGKAKPAFALLAAGAGALLGRKQIQKRKHPGVATPAAPAPEVYTAPTVAGGGETPLRPPAA